MEKTMLSDIKKKEMHSGPLENGRSSWSRFFDRTPPPSSSIGPKHNLRLASLAVAQSASNQRLDSPSGEESRRLLLL